MKNHFTKYKAAFFILLLAFVGCGNPAPSVAQPKEVQIFQTDVKAFPTLPSPQVINNGIIVYKVRLNKQDESSDVWIYLPDKQTKDKIPAILITAAGSYLWNGTALDEGDQPEHLPYVRAGYAVIAYETPGNLGKTKLDNVSDEELGKAVTDFKNSKAGLIQQQNALNYALEKIQTIDAGRIYIAGHSSAATHSLLVAASEPRVKAAIAYAPATDLEKRLASILDSFEQAIPGYKNFIAESSPKNNVAKIKIPVFVFQATDDSVIRFEDTKVFVTALEKDNKNVAFIIVNEGDHYESMIKQGIPKAIEWLNKIAFNSPKTK